MYCKTKYSFHAVQPAASNYLTQNQDGVDGALNPKSEIQPTLLSDLEKPKETNNFGVSEEKSLVSNLDLENKLLKNELQSLHEELAALSTKLKGQQQGLFVFFMLLIF